MKRWLATRRRVRQRRRATLRVPNLPGGGEHPFYVHGEADRYVSDCIVKTGQMEPLETRVFFELLPHAHGFLDVGANLGYYSVLAGLATPPDVPILAIEPDPANAALARCNFRLDPRTRRVRLRRYAVSDRPGKVMLYQSDDNFGDHRIAPAAGEDRVAVAVKTVTLASLLEDEPAMDFIKLDTQGAEAKILRPARAVLQARRDRLILIFEFWPQVLQRDDAEAVVARLDTLGLQRFDLDEFRGEVRPVTAGGEMRYYDDCRSGRDERPFTNYVATAVPAALKALAETCSKPW
jgi:FkbM family methyltransferase